MNDSNPRDEKSHRNRIEAKPHTQILADGGVTWGDLSGRARDLLLAIAVLESKQGPVRGVDIRDYRQEQEGDKDIPTSAVYPVLNRLTEDGLVQKRAYNKRTNDYTLTADGRRLLEDRLEEHADALGKNINVEANPPRADGGTTVGCSHDVEGTGQYVEVEREEPARMLSGYVCGDCADYLAKFLETPPETDADALEVDSDAA